MRLAGVDYSITCPAICIHDDNNPLTWDNCLWYYNQKGHKQHETNFPAFNSDRFFDNKDIRLYALADWALSIIVEHNVDAVALEGYAMGACGRVFDIAEATGLLKSYLRKAGIPLYIFAPTFNKKSFSGKGNANKEKMIDTFNQKNKINIAESMGYKPDYFGSPISDIVDSYSLIDTFLKERIKL